MTTVQASTTYTGDAWGELLRDCHRAGVPEGRFYELCERDDGYISVYDAAGFFAGPQDWPGLDQWAYSKVTGRTLDVGVGAGRFALTLQENGADVVGLDVSEGAVEVCAERGLKSVVLGTVDDLGDDERFDSFLLLGKNLGLLESREEGPRLLSRLARVARPGATVIGTGVDPYRLSDPRHADYLERNRRQDRLSGQMRLRLRHGWLATDWFDYLFVSPAELEEMIAGTGWSLVDVEEEGSGYGVVLRLTGDTGAAATGSRA
ncbi:class I SAM-dependent methyltransferase [Streptomyces sp. NPDC051569]|uniref:class I SAM-dependent methyltransferase n=1 Tax=Streptomyces sp. NPDC051569 TaxID=3365661 RepID=UPI0037A5CB05